MRDINFFYNDELLFVSREEFVPCMSSIIRMPNSIVNYRVIDIVYNYLDEDSSTVTVYLTKS